MSLRHSPDLHAALQAAADDKLVHHGITSPHVAGYSWASGGEIPLLMQFQLQTLAHAQLIGHKGHNPCGNRVRLTRAGLERLDDWNSHNAGRVA